MNEFQNLWWQQAKSDYDIFELLKSQDKAQCHQLHYLQMVTEKLAKGYFWRSGTPPPQRHVAFIKFLRALGGVQQSQRSQVIKALNFPNFEGLQDWIRRIDPLAYSLEHLAPALSNDGPNPEYPWPHHSPTNTPVTEKFQVWQQLIDTGQGRKFLKTIKLAVDNFPVYA